MDDEVRRKVSGANKMAMSLLWKEPTPKVWGPLMFLLKQLTGPTHPFRMLLETAHISPVLSGIVSQYMASLRSLCLRRGTGCNLEGYGPTHSQGMLQPFGALGFLRCRF